MQLVHRLSLVKSKDVPATPFSFNKHRRLIYKQQDGYKVILFDDISHLQSDSNYTKIFLKNGECKLLCKTLKTVESQLDEQFLRIHHSIIINLLEVVSYNTKDSYIALFSGEELNVSRRKKKEISELFKTL